MHTHTHRGILFGIKKEGDPDTCDIMDELTGRHVKGKISARERHMLHCGFRKGRGTRDQIANTHWIIEKAREFQKNIF